MLLALQPLRAFDDRVPPGHQRDHEHVHLQVVRSLVAGRRFVTEREPQVVVDLVAERETEAVVVELFTFNAVDAGFAAAVPGGVERREPGRRRAVRPVAGADDVVDEVALVVDQRETGRGRAGR